MHAVKARTTVPICVLLRKSASTSFKSPYTLSYAYKLSTATYLKHPTQISAKCFRYCSRGGLARTVRPPLFDYRSGVQLACVRDFHLNGRHLRDKDSSKVEQTVKALKEQEKEKSGLAKESASNVKDIAVEPTKAPIVAPPKRSIPKRVWDELVHYYHGFRLLFLDFRIAFRLVRKTLGGEDLTRREYRQLTRTTADFFRLLPFSVFVIIPFMELLLPVFLKFFPGMLPSTFQTTKDKESKIKSQLKVKLEMTKFLSSTLDEMALQSKGESHSNKAKEFAVFFENIRKTGQEVKNEDILKYSKLFEDEITLDSLSRPQLTALCRLLELQPIGTNNFLRFQLRMQLRRLKADDRMIKGEGINSLTVSELQQACRSRGMRALGVPEDRLRTSLSQWLELSLTEGIPPSLLLLSRVLYLPENIAAADQLKATIQALPLEAATEAKYKIGETEGKIDNKTKLELIRQEEAAIKKEKEEAEKEKIREVSETIIDKAEILLDKAIDLKETTAETVKEKILEKETELSKEDLQSLEDAVEEIERQKKSLEIEKEDLQDIKEEMADYKEDIEEFKEVTLQTGNKELRESKAARNLRKKVERMVTGMDKVLGGLETKKLSLQQTIGGLIKDAGEKTDAAKLVNINELIEVMKKVGDDAKVKKIIEVLDLIDTDHDGNVEIELVTKVTEFLLREDVKVTKEQVKDIVRLFNEEDKIEEEEKKQKEVEKQNKKLEAEANGTAQDKTK